MAEPNPKILSLLEQVVHPIERVNVTLDVHGVFAFPEEWKTTDETKMLGLELLNGKILPRQLTEKEIKEQEELAAQKNKKAAKKEAKQEVQITPEEEEELRKQREREEEEERKRLEEWNALDEITRFYRTQEDKYKSASIKFESSAHAVEESAAGASVASASHAKEGTSLVIFEERVNDDKGDWIYLVKSPTLPEDELAKMRKGKPKNLNLNDLNPVVMRAWVNLDKFGVPGTSEITQRCKLVQHTDENAPPPVGEVSRPNLENTYILITIRLDTPITPLVTEIQPKIADLIPQPPPIPKLSAANECIQEFKSELQLAMESLAIEYSTMFAKELGQPNDPKQKTTITVQKKQEIQKRKEHFLYDFNISGKYKVLKERLKKSIVRICRDKFQKQGSITGITTDQKDQFYSELYVFLMEQTRQTLQDLIAQKKEELHEDIVTSYEQTQIERDRILQNITKESEQDRMLRLALEYEQINLTDLAEKNYRNLVSKDERNPKNYYRYTRFLLNNKNFAKAEQMLEKALSFDEQNTEYQLLMTLLLLRRGRAKEAGVFLRELLQKDPTNLLYNSIISLAYKKFLGEDKLGEKFKRISERIYQRKRNNLQSKGQHRQQPNPFELPSLKPISAAEAEAQRPPQLEKAEWDEIYLEMIELFAKYNIFDLVDKSYDLISDSTTYRAQRLQCQLLQFRENYTQCLQILDRLYDSVNQDKSKKRELEEIITIKANLCYQTGQLYESEDIFLKAIKLKGSKKQDLSIYLRLGNIYLKRKSWGDAKAIFVRSCELKNNSSLSWLGLGIACLRIEEYREAEEALTQANIYDPFNGDTWGYLALLCLKDKGRFTQANQCLRELFKTDCSDTELLEELGDALSDLNQNETAETIYLKVVELQGKNKIMPPNYGELNLKLGKTYVNLKKYGDALVCFDEALLHLEGENDRNTAQQLKRQAQAHTEASGSDND